MSLYGKMIFVDICDKYVVYIKGAGSFYVDIYFKSKDMSKRIRLFTYDFWCK